MKKYLFLVIAFGFFGVYLAGAQEAAGVKSTMQTQVRIQSGDVTDDGSVERVLPTVNKINEESAERVLPTVNKATDESAAAAERVLPTVNKRTAEVIVRGWDAENKSAVQDFEKNTEGIAAADSNIKKVDVSPEGIKVAYKRNAKLFGFLPVAYQHAFTVDGKGNVSNGRPWWLAFASSDATDFADAVESDFQKNQSQLRWIKAPTALEAAIQRLQALADILKSK